MKTVILSSLLAVITTSVLAQGTVDLSNWAPWANPPVNAPFLDNSGALLAGPGYLAQLYAGSTAGSLAPVGMPTPFTTGGYFEQENVTVLVPVFAPVWAQVRAWDDTGGAKSYEQAVTSGRWAGVSNVLLVPHTGGGSGVPLPPGELIGLQFIGVPEPSVLSMGLLACWCFSIFATRRPK